MEESLGEADSYSSSKDYYEMLKLLAFILCGVDAGGGHCDVFEISLLAQEIRQSRAPKSTDIREHPETEWNPDSTCSTSRSLKQLDFTVL